MPRRAREREPTTKAIAWSASSDAESRPEVTHKPYGDRVVNEAPGQSRLRLALLGPTYPFRGGIAHHTTLLAQALRRRHDVLFASYSEQYPRWLFPGRTDRDPSPPPDTGSVERLLAPLRPWSWVRTARRIGQFRPSLLIVPWWVPFWAPSVGAVTRIVRRGGETGIVVLCHNITPHEAKSTTVRRLTAYALGAADVYIVHSAADERALRALLPHRTARPAAVMRALLPAHTIAEPMDRSEARARLEVPDDARVALFFGFVRPYKGLEHLIDALPEVAARVPELLLVVAGEFWVPAAAILRRASALGVGGRVRLDDGYVPNDLVGAYFSAADVVVMPYVEATQSGVVTLASQFGVPVVATRVGGLPEVVLDGETGLIVEPGSPAALAEAMTRVLTDEATSARLRAGTLRRDDRFDWDNLVALIEDIADATH